MARSGWSSAFILLAGISRSGSAIEPPPPGVIRVAKSHAPIGRDDQSYLAWNLAIAARIRDRNVARGIQRARPDILVLNNFDYDLAGRSVTAFRGDSLARSRIVAGAIRSPASPG